MTDTPEVPNPEAPEPTPTPETPETPKLAAEQPKGFTQEQLDRHAGKARKDGEVAARKAMAEELGMTLEEVSALVKSHNEKQEAEKTELQRLQDALDAAKRESEANTTKLQQELHTDRVKLRLSRFNLALPEDKGEADKALDRVVGLVSAPVGATYEDIDSNIEELKTQFPNLFTAPATQPVGNVPSNPSGTARKPSLGTDLDYGAQRAAQENAKRGVTTPA